MARTVVRLVAIGAAAALLAACGGDGERSRDGGTAGESSAGTDGVPLAVEIDPGFLDGVEQAWELPGMMFAISADGSFVAAQSSSGVSVYEVAATLGEPIWTGECGVFGFAGASLACDSTIVDPQTGESIDLPVEVASPVANGEGILVVNTVEGDAVGLDASGAEVWRLAGVEAIPNGAPGSRTLTTIPEGAAFSEYQLTDITTGESLGAFATTRAVSDGYGTLVGNELKGYTWDGQEVASMQASVMAPVIVTGPLGGSAPVTLADLEACYRDAPAPRSETFRNHGCFASGDGYRWVEFAEDAWTLDGVSYPPAYSVFPFVDEDHVAALELVEGEGVPRFAVYEIGTPEPLWTSDSSSFFPALGGAGLLGGGPGGMALYTPAG